MKGSVRKPQFEKPGTFEVHFSPRLYFSAEPVSWGPDLPVLILPADGWESQLDWVMQQRPPATVNEIVTSLFKGRMAELGMSDSDIRAMKLSGANEGGKIRELLPDDATVEKLNKEAMWISSREIIRIYLAKGTPRAGVTVPEGSNLGVSSEAIVFTLIVPNSDPKISRDPGVVLCLTLSISNIRLKDQKNRQDAFPRRQPQTLQLQQQQQQQQQQSSQKKLGAQPSANLGPYKRSLYEEEYYPQQQYDDDYDDDDDYDYHRGLGNQHPRRYQQQQQPRPQQQQQQRQQQQQLKPAPKKPTLEDLIRQQQERDRGTKQTYNPPTGGSNSNANNNNNKNIDKYKDWEHRGPNWELKYGEYDPAKHIWTYPTYIHDLEVTEDNRFTDKVVAIPLFVSEKVNVAAPWMYYVPKTPPMHVAVAADDVARDNAANRHLFESGLIETDALGFVYGEIFKRHPMNGARRSRMFVFNPAETAELTRQYYDYSETLHPYSWDNVFRRILIKRNDEPEHKTPVAFLKQLPLENVFCTYDWLFFPINEGEWNYGAHWVSMVSYKLFDTSGKTPANVPLFFFFDSVGSHVLPNSEAAAKKIRELATNLAVALLNYFPEMITDKNCLHVRAHNTLIQWVRTPKQEQNMCGFFTSFYLEALLTRFERGLNDETILKELMNAIPKSGSTYSTTALQDADRPATRTNRSRMGESQKECRENTTKGVIAARKAYNLHDPAFDDAFWYPKPEFDARRQEEDDDDN